MVAALVLGLFSVPVLAEYADASAHPRRPEDQIRIYKRALGIMDNHYGDDSKEYAELSFRMGRNVYELSASPWGEKYVDRACDLFEKHYGPNDRRVGACKLTLRLMVQSLEETSNQDEATAHLLAIGRELELTPPDDYTPVYRVPGGHVGQGCPGLRRC
jgi:hypothetical protein